MRDLYNSIRTALALAPAVQSAAVTGPAISLKGAKAAAFTVSTGAIAGSGNFGVTIQESDDGSSWADAAAAQIATNAPATLEQNSAYRLGYFGFKAFARLSVTKAGGTSIAIGASAVLLPYDRP